MRTQYVPPADNALDHTSGWANFFLARDHATKMSPAAPAEQSDASDKAP